METIHSHVHWGGGVSLSFHCLLDLDAEGEMKDLFLELQALLHPVLPLHYISSMWVAFKGSFFFKTR